MADYGSDYGGGGYGSDYGGGGYGGSYYGGYGGGYGGDYGGDYGGGLTISGPIDQGGGFDPGAYPGGAGPGGTGLPGPLGNMNPPDFGGSGWGQGGHVTSAGGGGGGSNANVGAQLSYAAAMNQLAEQIRQFDITQGAQKTSAQQAVGGITNMVNQYNQAFAQAKGEYSQRYNQMLGIADTTTGQQQADVRSQYSQQAASGMQNLQRLGMGNTTIGNTMNLGIQNQQSQALNRLADQMQQTKLGIIGGHLTDQQLAPNSDLLKAAISAGSGASGYYGGMIPQALGGLSFGGGATS